MKSASHSGGSPGIVIVPGAMAFTRTSGASAFASTFVSITTPAFEAECAMYPGHPSRPPVSAKLMMVPFVRRRRGAAACEQKKGAFRLVSSEASQISSVVETMLEVRKFAALLTRISSRPNCLAVPSNNRLISETFVKSAAIAQLLRPSFSISPTADCASLAEVR